MATTTKKPTTSNSAKAKTPKVKAPAISTDLKSTDLKTVLAQVGASIKAAANPAPRIFSAKEFPVGKTFPQGDVIITRLDPEAAKKIETSGPAQSRQLAPGTSMGSQHVVAAGPEVLTRKTATALEGPIISAKKAWTVAHPKHRDITFPAGIYAVTFPRDFAREELARRRD